MIQAQTFTFKYNMREDRIIMTLNYASAAARLDLMLTRAMILKLIPVIEQIYLSAPVNTSKEKTAVLTQKNEKKTDSDLLELIPHQYLLLEKIDFKSFENKAHIALLFYVNNKVVAQALLNPENFKQVMDVLIQSIPHHAWGIAANILEL
jgi:hypothetical protein